MKKIILAMVVVFALSTASYAAGPVWGVGVENALASVYALEFGGLTQLPAGTLFFNFNNQNSIEGEIGILQHNTEGGAKESITVYGLKYLFNYFTSAKFNSHVGIQGSIGAVSDGGKATFTDISLLFGGEVFITDHLSVLADMTASSSNLSSDPSDSDDYSQTGLNIFPVISFRIYM